MAKVMRECLLLSLFVVFAAATNNTTAVSPTPAPQILFSSNSGGGGGGGGELAAAVAKAQILTETSESVDGSAGASLSVEGATVSIPAGAFDGAVVVTITMKVFNAGTAVVPGVVRSSIMSFSVGASRVQLPIDIGFVVAFRRRQVADGNELIMSWLNKKTNSWTPICARRSLDVNTLEFTTATPAEVFNDPAFNPSSGCAPDLIGPCDGSGGDFTVFEMSTSTCSDTERLSDGAIAGIVIGIAAGLALIAIGAWWVMRKNSKVAPAPATSGLTPSASPADVPGVLP